MKIASHLFTLILGIALGVTWMSRPGQKKHVNVETPAPAVEKTVENTPEPAPQPVAEAPKTLTPAPAKAPKMGGAELQDAIKKNDILEATRIVQELEKSQPNSLEALEGRGALLMRMNDWRSAKTTMKKCLELHPESQNCLRGMAAAELRTGTDEDQETAVNQCLQGAPNDPECKTMQATLRLNHEEYDEAISIYEELMRDNGRYGERIPQDSLDWQMALTLEEAGRDQEAETYFDKACRANNAEACRRVEEMRGQY
jgi:tetratricopeptide (TPR) repeat protein